MKLQHHQEAGEGKRQAEAVNKIDLCKQFLGPEGAQTLADALTRASLHGDAPPTPLASARSVLLGADEIGPEGAMAIAAMLHHNKTLRTVFLGCNDIGPKGAAALADSLKENKTVEALWLKRNSIGPEGAKSLARVLAGDNDALLLLDLVFNKIGPEGGQHLARLLEDERCRLEVLFLGGNALGPAGSARLAHSLEHNRVLQELYLDVNDMGDEGAAAFARVLATNSTLRALTLASNDIGDDGAAALAEALIGNPNSALQMLNLGYQKSTVVMGGRPNRIGDAGVAALARMLATNRTLVALNLNKNQVTRVGARALGRALASNRSLRVLELRANYQLGDDGVVDLLDAMATNDTLAALDLVGCQVGLVGLRRLLRHVETHPSLISVHLGGWKTRQADDDDGGDESNEDDGSAHDVARRVMEQVKANRDRHGHSAQQLFNSVGRCYGGKRVETWLDDIRSIYRVPKTDHTDGDADAQPKPTAKKEVKKKKVWAKVNNNSKPKATTPSTTTDTTPAGAAGAAGATVKPGLRLSVESCLRTRLLNQLRHNQQLAARLAVEEDKNDITGSDASFAWAKALPGDGLRAALQQAMVQGKRLEAHPTVTGEEGEPRL